MAEAGVGFVDILPKTDQFVTRLSSQVKGALSKVQAETSSSSSTLTKGLQAGFVALGVVAVAAITKGIEATTQWADQVRQLQRITGQTAEDASSFAAAANVLGIGVDKLSVGFGILAKNVVTNSKALSDYGITTTDAQGNTLDFETVLGEVADKVQSLPPGLERAGLAQRVFGRSGRQLLPILQNGAAGFDELRAAAEKSHLVLSQKNVDDALKLSIAQRELGESIHGAAIQLGKEFLPAATEVVKVITFLIQKASDIPAPILAAGAAVAVLTGAIAALQLIGGFFVTTWTKLLTTVGLTGTTSAEASAGVDVLAASLAAESAAAAVATEGLVGYSTTVSGLIVPTEALGVATAATEAEVGAVGGGGLLGSLGGVAVVGAPVVAAVGAIAGSFLIARHAAAQFDAGVTKAFESLKAGGKVARDVRRLATSPVQAPFGINPAAEGGLGRRFIGSQFPIRTEDVRQAQEALARFQQQQALTTTSTQKLTTSIRSLLQPIDDLKTPITDIAGLTDSLTEATARTGDEFANLSRTSGQDFKSIGQGVQQALADPKTTVEQLPAIFSDALGKVRSAMRAWHDQIVSDFGGAQAALSDFLGQATGSGPNKVSFGDLTKSLQDTRAQLRRWSADFSTILKDSGAKAKRFLQDMSANGLQSIGILDAVAGQPKKIRDQFLAQYNDVNKATDSIAGQITDAFGKAADRIVLQLKNIFRAIEGLPPIRPKVDNSQAIAALNDIIAREQFAFQLGKSGNPTGPLPPGPVNPHQTATGGIIHGATGFVTNGPVFEVGERGRELVDPLEGDRAKHLRAQSIADALKILGVGGSQKDMRVHVTVGIDDSGNLQVRRIARDEIDREHDYRVRVG